MYRKYLHISLILLSHTRLFDEQDKQELFISIRPVTGNKRKQIQNINKDKAAVKIGRKNLFNILFFFRKSKLNILKANLEKNRDFFFVKMFNYIKKRSCVFTNKVDVFKFIFKNNLHFVFI